MSASSGSSNKREFLRCLKDARIGDAAAQYELALMFANGVGVAKNLEQALYWARSAADKGHVSAQYLLARSYQQGLGTERDTVNALSWYQKAAERGNDKAALKLAGLYADAQDEVAFHYALLGAKAGSPQAKLIVGERIAVGLGVMRNSGEGFQWLLNAAEDGLPRAQMAVGKAFEFGIGVETDLQQACKWYRKAAAQGMPAAQLALVCVDKLVGRTDSTGKQISKRMGSRERRLTDSRWVTYSAKGGPDDFYHLGLMFESGIGVERSTKQARLWYLKAAESGHIDAMLPLARLLMDADPRQAGLWLTKAAELNLPEAQFELGRAFITGNGVGKDIESACFWFAQAARLGHAASKFELAHLMQGNLKELRREWLLAAAHSGIPQAQHLVAERYAAGDDVTQDWGKACQWYKLAADQNHEESQCALATCFSIGRGVEKDVAKAFYWFEKAASLGNGHAQWSLGQLIAVGIPGVERDAKQALLLCKRAAKTGFIPAQATLGTLFARAKKYDRAVEWWTKAATQGDQEAQFNLSNALREGLGVEKNLETSFEWLLEAAANGLSAAQARVGLAYATGEGAVLDPIESAKWLILAADRGDSAASANKRRSKSILSPAQWAEAERRAKSWQPSSSLAK